MKNFLNEYSKPLFCFSSKDGVFFADLGMKVGKDRISRLLKLAREQQAQQQAKPEQPSQDPCTPILPLMNGVGSFGEVIPRRLGFDSL